MEESPDLTDVAKPTAKHASPQLLASAIYELFRDNYTGEEIRAVAAELSAMTVSSEQ